MTEQLPAWAEMRDRIREVLPRHPRLRGRPVPEVHADAGAVWLSLAGREVARIQAPRWWGPGTVLYARMLVEDLVREARGRRP